MSSTCTPQASDWWLLRWVPEPARGEFVNIGVIVHLGDELGYRVTNDLSRARALGGEPASILATVEWLISHALSSSSRLEFLEEQRRERRNLLQLSEPLPASWTGKSAHELAGFLFDRLVR